MNLCSAVSQVLAVANNGAHIHEMGFDLLVNNSVPFPVSGAQRMPVNRAASPLLLSERKKKKEMNGAASFLSNPLHQIRHLGVGKSCLWKWTH